jgi:hypothetical protein
MIVYGILEPLLATDVSFCCLNAYEPQQKLNLLELSAGLMRKARTSAPNVMRRHVCQPALRACFFRERPEPQKPCTIQTLLATASACIAT